MSSLQPDRIRELIRSESPLILDIGSNDGEHTQMFLDLFPYARVYAFEPEPVAIDLFRKRVTDPRATLVTKAVSNRDGDVTFHRSGGRPTPEWPGVTWHYSGSIRHPKNHLRRYPWCHFERHTTVSSIRLDSMVFDRTIDLIWADVQGAEADLILGGLETLKHTRFLYTEFSNEELYEGQPTLKQITTCLPDFDVVEVFSDDVLLKNRYL